MKDHTIDISCTGPTPSDTTVASGDKVTFDNTTGASVTIAIDSPGIFNPTPGSTIAIAKDSSKKCTVGNISNGTGFSYADCGEALGTRSGRIDP